MALEHKLPNGLLVILHLHLLDYPLQDATGYDERLFHHSRGMRDRNKAMEDITYFLVGKLEGGRERAKSILPTYPCLQPADTTAYRIALAKYLEGLRSAVAHASRAHMNDPTGKQPATPAGDEVSAWWWKDVVVRKSILDECSGDRFERLILALSSHAILKNAVRMRTGSPSSSLQVQGSSVCLDREGDLGPLSRAYTTLLSAAQESRREWERTAAVLVQKQSDLAAIRARMADPRLASSSSNYDDLTTDRLLALRDSRVQDLLRGSWRGDEGRSALRFITDLAGLLEAPTSTILGSRDGQDAGIGASVVFLPADSHPKVTSGTSPPLPIAAAHHPAHLHSLHLPLFPASDPSQQQLEDSEKAVRNSTPHAVTERLAAIEKVHSSLQDALEGARSIHAQLQQRLQQARARKSSQPSAISSNKMKGSPGLQLDASLWQSRGENFIDFKKVPDASTLARFSLDDAVPSETAIEDRVAHIRSALLPPFTAEPLPASDSEPEPESEPEPKVRPRAAVSRIRQPSARGDLPTAVPRTNHRGGAAVAAGSSHASGPPGQAVKVPPPARQVRVAYAPQRAPLGTGQPAQGDPKAGLKARRLSRRASAARARRSTMFGRGEDADILRIVAAVEDRSDPDSEDGGFEAGREPTTPFQTPRRSPTKALGTRGTLLSTLKKSAPRQSFDIERYERVQMPRLSSLRRGLEAASELDEDGDDGGSYRRPPREDVARDGNLPEEHVGEMPYEGNSMTLADILLHAGHQGNVSAQLLGEDDLDEGDDLQVCLSKHAFGLHKLHTERRQSVQASGEVATIIGCRRPSFAAYSSPRTFSTYQEGRSCKKRYHERHTA